MNTNLIDTVQEDQEWCDSLEWVLQNDGHERAEALLRHLGRYAKSRGLSSSFPINTSFINTIAPEEEAEFPGDLQLEQQIENIIRWNAMVMVVRANRSSNLGGHISTYASTATLFEVGFNHFFRAKDERSYGDMVYFQGHASPGIYARAFLEGRISQEQLDHFRRETNDGKGLSSYPHPWLMPNFWEFPTVSMGLGPLMAIYQARFCRYLENRGMREVKDDKIWCFIGDGETDEPETLGAIGLATREKLDNLIFVINCNLQRLDGPVRGNSKIIAELETIFQGAGWYVIKVLWGENWDPLFANDTDGLLSKRLDEVVDGDLQKYTVASGDYIRQHFFAKPPRLLDLVSHLSDQDLQRLRRGGHERTKVYAAYKAAVRHRGKPTVILALTVKGYGLGNAGEGLNITHQQKQLTEEQLRGFRTRFNIPIEDGDIAEIPFYRPDEESAEIRYLHQQRKRLGGYIPNRKDRAPAIESVDKDLFEEFYHGTEGRAVSTTMAYVRILGKLLKDKKLGKYIIPIIPDEARTFGMEALFRQCGIYSAIGQVYEPVDKDQLLYYKEAKNGQILEEGINEAGAMASFIAAGTAHVNCGINTIPFFTYYSMFGFQRVGDLIWAAGDLRCRGFLIGATSGRSTLNGEGLQHEDGHSHLVASTIPNLVSYDPAFAYELAVIIEDGLRRMYQEKEDIFYYITVQNEDYPMLPMPEGDGIREGILKGLYRLRKSTIISEEKAHLFGSAALINTVLKARDILERNYHISVDVWSVTSYTELRRDADDAERWNRLHPDKAPKRSYLQHCLAKENGVFVAVTDYMKALPDGIRQWLESPFTVLGTDGFGRSDTREALRDFFEIDERYIVLAVLHRLYQDNRIPAATLKQAMQELNIDSEKANPRLI